MKKLFPLALLAATVLLSGCHRSLVTDQPTYGGTDDDRGLSVQQTADGGYIIAGSTCSFGAGGADVYLIRTNAQLDTLWTRTYGDTGYDVGTSVQQTADGGYIIAGATTSFSAGGCSVYLIRANASGDPLWSRTYRGTRADEGPSVQQTRDSGYIVAGTTERSESEIYLIKTDASGDTLWTGTYGRHGDASAYSVEQTTDGGYIIAGRSLYDYAAYLIKTNAQGDTLWTRIYRGPGGNAAGRSVRQTSDGGYIVAGYKYSSAVDPDVYLIKTDAAGDSLWARTYGGERAEYGYSVQQTTDGGYVIASYTASFGAGGADSYLIKTNTSGDTLWTRTYGGAEFDVGFAVQQTTDGGYIIAGTTRSFGAGDNDVYLIKTDANGDIGTE
ncbi:hypothetical protein JXD38_11490 [candidate division WOR-3 bacterium]|nr:hypothetical protein [candidate division WOR-3 bacterium]